MKRKWAVFGLIAAAACVFLPAGVKESGRPAFEARRLEEELSLAKSQSYYFLLDLGMRRMELRVSGLPLRSWELVRVRVWGDPAPLAATALLKKTAIRPPKRVVIKPGGDEEAPAPAPPTKKTAEGEIAAPAFELEALELKDMPPVFQLSFDNGFEVSVVTGDKGLKGRLNRIWNELRWSVGMPLFSFMERLRNRSFRMIEITLKDKPEAQALYWAFFEGIKGLVWY
jgi:hypothetical protein